MRGWISVGDCHSSACKTEEEKELMVKLHIFASISQSYQFVVSRCFSDSDSLHNVSGVMAATIASTESIVLTGKRDKRQCSQVEKTQQPDEEESLEQLAKRARRNFQLFVQKVRSRPRKEFITCSDDKSNTNQTAGCFSGNKESNRRVRWKCDLCSNDLAAKQIEQEIDVLYVFPEVSVLPCGHVYHSTYLLHDISSSHLHSRDPPCLVCDNASNSSGCIG
ncbi:hypothetical protein ACOSQ3_012746 [Xanthoceras sorbifolium]